MTEFQCPICNAPVTKHSFLKDSRIFHHCDNCGFIALEPKFLLDPKEEKRRYELHENNIENEGYVAMFNKFIEQAVDPYKKDVRKILDYGSGPGPVLAELLKRKGFEVDAYDPYFAPRDFSDDDRYDLICSTETFEHFNKPLETIEKIVKLMKPNAYLSIMTSFACSKEEFESWWYKNDETHVAFYSPKTFEKIGELFSLELIWHNEKNTVVFQKQS